jgi:hypothetical protein
VALAELAENHQLGERILPKFSLAYLISPAWRFNANFQVDINNTKTKTFLPQNATGRPFTDNIVNAAG